MSIDARVGERALREIYLRGFEIALAECAPLAVMSAYNLVNGVSASESPRLLTDILRDEWGFAGLVVSDWGAVDDPAAAVAAGLDLEMPGSRFTPPRILQAVRSGELDEAVLDRAVSRVLQLADSQAAMMQRPPTIVTDAHHALAREAAMESMVLLENRDGFLPLTEGDGKSLGIVGRLAMAPRVQGVGSSQVRTTRVDSALPYLTREGTANGFTVGAWTAKYEETGLNESQKSALESCIWSSDVVLAFVGQRASQDSEAADRTSIQLSRPTSRSWKR